MPFGCAVGLLTHIFKERVAHQTIFVKKSRSVGMNSYPGREGIARWIGMKKLPVAVSIARRAENLVFSASLSNHSLNDFSSFKRKKEVEAKYEKKVWFIKLF